MSPMQEQQQPAPQQHEPNQQAQETQPNENRSGTSAKDLEISFRNHMTHTVGRPLEYSTTLDQYHALSAVVRDRLMDNWLDTIETYRDRDVRVVGYLSAEYLLGPHLENDLLNLDLTRQMTEALNELGLDLKTIACEEPEPGLGNGGLGRLAACFLDSLSTLNTPVVGYGLRYEFGIFRQEIQDGWQVEKSDKWLQFGNPWEIAASMSYQVGFFGHTETYTDDKGALRHKWIPGQCVKGIPYDTPIPGYQTKTVNRLRLWKSEAIDSFDLATFNTGDYTGAVRAKMESETISKVLYPPDEKIEGKRLRLMQQYFFTSCSLQDMVQLHLTFGKPLNEFDKKWTVQLNDTHPSIGIAELMRLLMDEHAMPWDEAWRVTQNTFGYTNHTLLPEALERWPLEMFGNLLPRHLEIIDEINEHFLDAMRLKFPNDDARMRRMSIIGEDGERSVQMAKLAVVGSKAINGVAELHTNLLEASTLKDFYEAFPERFSNKTNGVTPRRWLMLSNPDLTALIDETIGTRWHKDLYGLTALEHFATDTGFLQRWRKTQEGAKARLGAFIKRTMSIDINPESMFDAQVKRLHEYKRQHLNALHILSLYCAIKNGTAKNLTPRTFLFGGKAAPSYTMAKLIIKLICTVGDLVNNDPQTRDLLKVIFVPNYSVSVGQRIYPAADLSEQISTAGLEASGTGCMKFMMNGAVAIGTLDGANIEIREEAGEDNFFLFGLTAPQIADLTRTGYSPNTYYDKSPALKEVIDGLRDGRFSNGDRDLFAPLVKELTTTDRYFVMADFDAYAAAQAEAGSAYGDTVRWGRMSLLNTARSGKFSSDRTIREYCKDIWKVPTN
ncbi:glycogen/starch/alpha-glucan phosphorylase [Terriglobus roseus DSM 18391]|uniref:Alpha-1,4 glucan phosphorylase n=1 Tax=Terriglobus roseus (strain DSM 18391 / NRRL B-41598 / KBS 63) TaxID=926566 RepID=I3ZBN9_TERRK|nr:glycogen/starch/alpha-glucan phosphorylase [Terriglobus roseus]AFL86657.1 glycogen/starch/alpha-glucan phosphorylase [Terriglobus roseus DSM 18391]